MIPDDSSPNALATDVSPGAQWLASPPNVLAALGSAQSNPLGDAISPGPIVSPTATNPLAAPAPTSDEDAKRMVLNKIYSGESNSYNEIYGGKSFDSYADHPRQRQVITEGPHKGEYSDAAGAPQFLSSTWDAEKTKLGLKDFSPASQDAAAWDLAQTTYKSSTGRDLAGDAKAGKVEWGALAGQWPSLAGQEVGPGAKDWAKGSGGQSRVQSVQSGQNSAPGAIPQTPSAQSDQLRGLLQLALIQAAFPQHKFTPIDYDPMKVRPVVGGPVV
jgi:muramidase (phage lysozyme)